MKTTRSILAGLVLLLGTCLGTVAVADDFSPPPWRGAPLSVMAEWDFLTPPDGQNLIHADTFLVGPPKDNNTSLHGQAPVAVTEGDVLYDGAGAWTGGPAGGALHFNLPNWIDMEPIKWVQVQMTFSPPPLAYAFPYVGLIEAFDPTIPGWTYQGRWAGKEVFDPNHIIEHWAIEPNPDWEIVKVVIPPGVVLDQVVIDTISTIPEPATAMLLVLGAVLVTLKRVF